MAVQEAFGIVLFVVVVLAIIAAVWAALGTGAAAPTAAAG